MNDPIICSYESFPFGSDLKYCHDAGIIYQNNTSESIDYGKQYFDNYVSREDTEIARKLNIARTSLVKKYCNSLLDVGIGSGEFIKSLKFDICYGYDVNPYGIEWLKERNIFLNPWEGIPDHIHGISLWDTMEHMTNPSEFLKLIKKQYVFISLPIFNDLNMLRLSKHYKTNEHYLYFSLKGILRFMSDCGFDIIEVNDDETLAGREHILSFAFRRKV